MVIGHFLNLSDLWPSIQNRFIKEVSPGMKFSFFCALGACSITTMTSDTDLKLF